MTGTAIILGFVLGATSLLIGQWVARKVEGYLRNRCPACRKFHSYGVQESVGWYGMESMRSCPNQPAGQTNFYSGGVAVYGTREEAK